MESRDCECDLQGIINNAVYLNYLEHSRHTFLRHVGLDFGKLHAEGADAIVRRIEIDYKRSLRGMEEFESRLQVRPKGILQYVFDQSIVKARDNEVMVKARTYVAFARDGKPIKPPEAVVTAIGKWMDDGDGTA